MSLFLPRGVLVGHVTDLDGWTGCTAILCPEGSTAACEVRGGGPGTRESDLLSPAASAPGANAILLTGGSAYGLAAADGVVSWLAEQGVGFRTRAGIVPLVASAVVFDLALGDPSARPGPEQGYAACVAAGRDVERGSVGAGSGCTVGKLLGPECWTKGGLGFAGRTLAGGGKVAAIAAVNAFGEVRRRGRLDPRRNMARWSLSPNGRPPRRRRVAAAALAGVDDPRLRAHGRAADEDPGLARRTRGQRGRRPRRRSGRDCRRRRRRVLRRNRGESISIR